MGSYDKIFLWSKLGMNTFTSTLAFFYSNPALVLFSLLPSCLRAYQMLHHLNAPFWVEILVGLTRMMLFLLIFAFLSKSKAKELFQKEFWDELGKVASKQMSINWPYVFIAQLIVFVVVLFGLMNLLVQLIVEISLTPLVNLLDIQYYDHDASRNALVFFFKNMSVIPLSMVYILKMCGVQQPDNSSKQPSV